MRSSKGTAELRLTASFGVATLPVSRPPLRIGAAADLAMYQVKDSGKNGVRVAQANKPGTVQHSFSNP